MENFDFIYNSLPLEITNKILYEFKGLTHPTASIISHYWEELDIQYSVFLNIQKVITRKHIEHGDDTFTINTSETYTEEYLDSPRMFFPIDYDFIETLIYELYDDADEVYEDIEYV